MKQHEKSNVQNIEIHNLQMAIGNNNTTNGTQPQLKKGGSKKIAAIIGAVATFCTISGISIYSVYNHINDCFGDDSLPEIIEPLPEAESSLSGTVDSEEYKIFLFSEYSKITIYQETNMTATLNFETNSVSITAYLASGKNDTLSMSRKNSTEWEEKVIFNETGTHKIVATAVAPDGSALEDIIEVEVIPISFDEMNLDQLLQLN